MNELNMFINKFKKYELLSPILLGIIVFYMVCGSKILDP